MRSFWVSVAAVLAAVASAGAVPEHADAQLKVKCKQMVEALQAGEFAWVMQQPDYLDDVVSCGLKFPELMMLDHLAGLAGQALGRIQKAFQVESSVPAASLNPVAPSAAKQNSSKVDQCDVCKKIINGVAGSGAGAACGAACVPIGIPWLCGPICAAVGQGVCQDPTINCADRVCHDLLHLCSSEVARAPGAFVV